MPSVGRRNQQHVYITVIGCILTATFTLLYTSNAWLQTALLSSQINNSHIQSFAYTTTQQQAAGSEPLKHVDQQSNTANVQIWYMDDSLQPRYELPMNATGINVPDEFWTDRLTEQQVQRLSNEQRNNLTLDIYGVQYNRQTGSFNLIATIEWAPHTYYTYQNKAVSHQWISRDWHAKQNQQQLEALISRIQCRIGGDIYRPLFQWNDEYWYFELSCAYVHAPQPPPDQLTISITAGLSNYIDIPVISAIEPFVQIAHCGHVRTREPHGIYYVHDFYNYHMLLGIDLFHLTDRTPRGYYNVTQMYQQSGHIIYRHAPLSHTEVQYAYDQVIEIQVCLYRVGPRSQYVAHWDMDEWLVLPSKQSDKYHQTASVCYDGQPASTAKQQQLDTSSRHHNQYRDWSRYPLLQLMPVTLCNHSADITPVRSFIQSIESAQPVDPHNLDYERLLLLRYDAIYMSPADQQRHQNVIQAMQRSTGVQFGDRWQVADSVYMPTPERFSRLSVEPSPDLKYMHRPSMRGIAYIHNPVYTDDDMTQQQIAVDDRDAYLVHFVNTFAIRDIQPYTNDSRSMDALMRVWQVMQEYTIDDDSIALDDTRI